MRRLEGATGAAVALWDAASAAIHVYFAARGYLEPLRMRSLHLFLLLPLVFLLYPAFAGRSPAARPSLPDWLWAALSMAPSVYLFAYSEYVYQRSDYLDPLTPLEVALGAVCILAILEGARRAVTPVLSLLALATLAYMAVGHLLPGAFNIRYFSIPHVIETVYIANNGNGIYGMLTGISVNTVAIFVVFGAFVNVSGANRFLGNLGSAVAGRYAGGPAKVEVISSALFGTMSGSSVSNVVTTGTITIPLMKKRGYPAAVAGGIEAASSVGGALMPPVMGTAAFVMAEIINTPYSQIVVAAVLGSLLYYASILVSIDLEARKLGLRGLPPDQIPGWRVVLDDVHLLLPVAVLLWLLMEGWSPSWSAFCATVAMVAASALRRHTRMGARRIFEALAQGACTAAYVALAVAAAGIIAGALTNTGLFSLFGGAIRALAGGSFALLALLVMALCLVLGMGVPTTPAYIITAAVGAPLLTGADSGVSLLAAHMFIFYFAVLADATPPVAVASYAAAAIAQAPPMLTGLHAFRLAFGGFVVGYAYLFDPALMLRGPLAAVALSTLLYLAALTLVAAGLIGWLRVRLHPWSRAALVAAGAVCAFWQGWPIWERALGAGAVLGLVMALPALFGTAAAPAVRPQTAHD